MLLLEDLEKEIEVFQRVIPLVEEALERRIHVLHELSAAAQTVDWHFFFSQIRS